MAIKKDYTFKGFLISGVYVRVSRVEVCKTYQTNTFAGVLVTPPQNKEAFNMLIDVEISAGKGGQVIDVKRYIKTQDMPFTGEILKEAYEYVLSLPENEKAISV